MKILANPLDIFSLVEKYFKKAQANIEINADQDITQLAVRIPDKNLTIIFHSAVFQEELEEELQKGVLAVSLRKEMQEAPIDPSRYSLEGKKLCGWKQFRRMMFERRGNSVADEIFYFLQSENQEKVLFLGLAPHQVDEQFTETDLRYFREFLEIIKCSSLDCKDHVFSKFLEQYPRLSRHLLTEEHAKQIERSKREKAVTYQRVLNSLNAMVLGQPVATERLAVDLVSTDEKNKVYLFVGPTGVGKTELALSVSRVRNNGRMVVLNMSEYVVEHSVTKLLGAPIGYVGSTDKPFFLKEIESKCEPKKVSNIGDKTCYEVHDSILLFDELEKTHSKIKQALLSLFYTGSLTITYAPSSGANISVEYNFYRCIFISTSNLFQKEIRESFLNSPVQETLSQKTKRIEDLFVF